MKSDNLIFHCIKRFHLIQTDFIWCKPILSDANRFYPTQTDFIRKSTNQTDYITNISFISYFSYSRTKVTTTTPTTTITLLGPRCFATRGQKVSFFTTKAYQSVKMHIRPLAVACCSFSECEAAKVDFEWFKECLQYTNSL